MIQGLGPYPAYRDSGTRFLDPLPDHWKAVPLGRLGRFHRGIGGTKDDDVPEGVPVIRYGDLYTKYEGFITRSARFVNADRAADYAPIRRGDVLFAASGETIEEIGKSAVNLIDAEARCGGDVLIFRPSRGLLSRFLGYATNASYAVHQKATMGRGFTVVHIYANELRNLVLAVPTADEQAAIVRFIDYIHRRIRRYVLAQQRLIELLEEQRRAIIHRAVTRGLAAAVRLKPSGVEWLGDVPEHWEVRTLGQVAVSFRTGPFGSILHQSDYVEDGVPLVNPIHMQGGYIVEDRRVSVSLGVRERLSSYRLEKHNIVFARRGDLGRCALVRDREVGWLCGTGSIRVDLDYAAIEAEYLIQALQVPGVGEYLSLFSVGSTMANLNTGILKSLPVLIPPLNEQRELLAYIGVEGERIDLAMTATKREIELTREYRTRLIADVVTGKLDVREAAA